MVQSSGTAACVTLRSCLLQERLQLLTFVIVGGGPTGVEVAAELHDMITEDLKKVYPQLMRFVSIKLVELQARLELRVQGLAEVSTIRD